MSFVTTEDGTEIFYKDWGSGQPIMFHHGWPLSSDDWDSQMMFFLQHGYRVIAHDRRGHGRSSQTPERSRHGHLRSRRGRWSQITSTCATPSTSDTRPAAAKSPDTSPSTAATVGSPRRC